MNTLPRGWQAALNFLPAALCALLLLPFHLISADQQRAMLIEELSNGARHVDPVIAIAVVHILVYWVASLVTLRAFARRLQDEYSSLEKRRFRWLAWVLMVSVVMWLFWLLGLALRTEWTAWLDLIAVPLGLYVLAFAGLRQPAVFAEPRVPEPRASAPGGTNMPGTPPPTEDAAPRYARSGLDDARAAGLRAKLEALMEHEKPWLENDLTLTELAGRLGTSSHHLSQLLNEALGQSFFDYVNRRRVGEVQRCLADPAYASQTLLEVALAAGFNSKAAFNTAFRKHTGLTPSQFRRRSSPPSASPS
jgi:AraC-like DNA-binding protein